MRRTLSNLIVVAVFILAIIVIFAAITITRASADPQSRVYGPNGQSLGTIVPQGDGSTRYYDASGRSLGTSTTTGNTTKFYGPGGNVTGSVTGPATHSNSPFGRR